MRNGKPCSGGSGSPFMPTQSRGSRPSSRAATGVPIVMPSTERASSWSAPAWIPASRSSGTSGTPSQREVPM